MIPATLKPSTVRKAGFCRTLTVSPSGTGAKSGVSARARSAFRSILTALKIFSAVSPLTQPWKKSWGFLSGRKKLSPAVAFRSASQP